jgi:DNA-binding transcriptional ArsR family regulator
MNTVPFMNFMNITRALSDENRVRILMALRGHAFCVCQITAFLDLSPSTTSKHLSVLKQARLIEARKVGKWVYYSLAGFGDNAGVPDAPENGSAAQDAIRFVSRAIGDSPTIRRDEERISKIIENEKICFGVDADLVPDEFHSLAVHSLESAE